MGSDNQTNFLIPKHRKLAEDEAASILEKYKLSSKSKLPKINKNDPGLEGIAVEIGDVIEITRKSFAGESKYYRVVSE